VGWAGNADNATNAGYASSAGSAASATNASKLNNRSWSDSSTGSTVVGRNSSGDIKARLFRSEYDSTNSTINLIMTQVDTAGNNYIRPSTPAQFRAAVTSAYYLGKTATAAKANKLRVNSSSSGSYYNLLWHSGDNVYRSSSTVQATGSGKLKTASTITAGSTVYAPTFRISSAQRYKDISQVVTPEESLDKICQLGVKGVSVGKWKDQNKDTSTHRWLIAEQVDEVFPELVGKTEDGQCDTVSQTEIIADLVASVYALREELKALKESIHGERV